MPVEICIDMSMGGSQTQNSWPTEHARVLAQSQIQKREISENGPNGEKKQKWKRPNSQAENNTCLVLE